MFLIKKKIYNLHCPSYSFYYIISMHFFFFFENQTNIKYKQIYKHFIETIKSDFDFECQNCFFNLDGVEKALFLL